MAIVGDGLGNYEVIDYKKYPIIDKSPKMPDKIRERIKNEP
jgi:hypothetical protein